jgi:ankyrin repeat protein
MTLLPGGYRHSIAIATVSILSACVRGPGAAESAPPATVAAPAASSAPAPVSIPPSASAVALGTYWPESACTVLIEPSGRPVWNWCVESVTMRPSGELAFRCRWEFLDMVNHTIEKGPDEGNRNMYVVDGAGRRLDHVSTTEGARLGGVLAQETPTLRGDFVFPAGRPPFVFHDADNNVAIEGISLEPTRRGDSEGRGNPALRARLGQLRQAGEVVIDRSWSGLGKPSHNRYVLRRAGGGAAAGAAVPAAIMEAFLDRLARAPLVEGRYTPRYLRTDDHPHLAITIGTGDDQLVVFSESQGTDRYPWALQFEGRRYVLPSDAPARALDLLKAYLAAAEVNVAPGRPEEPPPPPPGRRRALASELAAATSRGDVARVRRLLSAGADPSRGDDATGVSAVHAASGIGHAEVLALFADAGAALDALDFEGRTPLVLAARGGHAEVVRILLQRGARSQISGALREAAGEGHLEAARLLLQAGAPADAADPFGFTPLMTAIGRGLAGPGVVKVLLDSGAAVNAVDIEGRTALHHLAWSATRPPARGTGSAGTVARILIAAGADPRIKDRRGQSVLDRIASRPGPASSEILAAIKEASPR